MKNSKYTRFAILTVALFTIFAFASTTFAADNNPNKNKVECKLSVQVSSFYDKDMIETQLKDHQGILDTYIDLDEKIAYITYDKTITNSEKVCRVINDLGFEAKVLEEKDSDLGKK
jgi:copper chaperone CopZ